MPITIVSSREFNQNTSAAKRAAEDGPVFITDRGQTAHVLMTITEYRKITSKGKNILELLAMPEDETGETDFDFDPPRMGDLARAADFS